MSPYLTRNRLQDIIGALQIMGSYRKDKLRAEGWKVKIENRPLSAETWDVVFKEHPEFFRANKKGKFSLLWRRGLPYAKKRRREPLSADQITALINTALRFHASALDERRDRRWWIPVLAGIVAAITSFFGAVLGAYIQS